MPDCAAAVLRRRLEWACLPENHHRKDSLAAERVALGLSESFYLCCDADNTESRETSYAGSGSQSIERLEKVQHIIEQEEHGRPRRRDAAGYGTS
jgi:hypothetical protein